MVKRVLLSLVVGSALLGALLWIRTHGGSCRPHDPGLIDDPDNRDDLHLGLPDLDATAWVRSNDPAASFAGYNLVFYRRRLPMIIDMNGRIVHAWPTVRAVGRSRLDSEGRLLVIGTDNLVKEYDWDGNLIWFFQLDDAHDFIHHDLIRTKNDTFLILAHDAHRRSDYLLEVDRGKRVVWQWRCSDHGEAFPDWDPESEDPTHVNSIRELPDNRWFAAGDERFRPGNILVSARNLNTVFIIDKATGEVVWQYSNELDRQHEAVMVERGQRGDGLVMLFNNGRDSRYLYRRSRVQLVDPTTNEVSWEYQSRNFFSTTGGTAQPLPGENVLITSSHSGRVFEVTPQHRIVWEWTPPYKPMRVERLALDHCPQLARLAPPVVTRVEAPRGGHWVDTDLRAFALDHEVKRRVVAGSERELTRENEVCRSLFIVPNSAMRVGYGISRNDRQSGSLEGRFRLTIRGGGVREKLVDATVAGRDAWIGMRGIPLDQFADRQVTMCLTATVVGGDGEDKGELVWGNPIIEPRSREIAESRPARPVTEQERRLQEQQLKALGYVD